MKIQSALVLGAALLGSGCVDKVSSDLEGRVQAVLSRRIDKFEFSDYSLLQCLRTVSDDVRKAMGRSFSIFFHGADPQPAQLISMRIRNLTVCAAFTFLAAASESKIEMTPNGCVVTSILFPRL